MIVTSSSYEKYLENNCNKFLDYEKIKLEINQYAKSKLKSIVERYGDLFSSNVSSVIENLLNKDIVIVDKPSELDFINMKGDIPSAHGGRTKNDGFIHIYPYVFRDLSSEEIIKKYQESFVITHELFHYIFKLDFYDIINDDDFNGFITEGIVQYFTELFEGRKTEDVNYRKNVELAEEFVDHLVEKDSLNRLFENKFSDSGELDFTYFIEKYNKLKHLSNILKDIVIRVCDDSGLDGKRFSSKIDRLTTKDSIMIVKNWISTLSQLDDESKKCYLLEIDDEVDHFYSYSNNFFQL